MKVITDNIGGHRAKYDVLSSHLSKEEAGIEFVGGGDPVWAGFVELEILRRFKDLQGSHVLDIGCGIGRLAKYLFEERVAGYLGLDIIPEILEQAIDASKAHPQFKYGIVEEFKVPAEAGAFDVVCGFSLITHLLDEEIFEYFTEARRVLKPDGVVIFSFLDIDIPEIRAMFFKHAPNYKSGHGDLMRFTTKSMMTHLAKGAGFSSVVFIDGFNNVSSDTRRAKLLDGRPTPASAVLGQSSCVMRA